MFEEKSHGVDVAGKRREQERRLAGEIDPRQGAAQQIHPSAQRRNFLDADVGIDAMIEKERNEIQNHLAIVLGDHVLEGDVMQIHIPHFHGSEQRSAAIPIDRIDVGATIDEETGHVDMVVADRHEQRIDVVLVDFIHVGAGVQQ